MSKPTLSRFLSETNAIGNAVETHRGIMSFYGYIGANLDARDWDAIMEASDPYEASISALKSMYSDTDYLLTNSTRLLTLGYSENQIAYTYKLLSQTLGFAENIEWASGTSFEAAVNLPMSQARTSAAADYVSGLPVPILTLSNDADGLKVQADQDGRLLFDDGTFVGNLVAGNDLLLGELGALNTGRLRASSDKDSALTDQFYTLGTVGNDTFDSSGNGAQVDYVDTGAGDDVITGGGGADILYAGAGDDTIRGDDGDVRLDGGDGNDTLEVDANFTANLGLVNRIEEITATAAGLTINLTGTFFGGVINSFAAGATTITSSNGDDTMNGGAGNDVFNGNAGNNTFTGNGGNDTYNSGVGTETYNANAGSDTISSLQGSSIFVVSAGADLTASVGGNFTATAASRNLGGANTDAVFNVDVLNATSVNFSAMTVATATTDGITINSTGRALANVSYIGSNGDDVINSSNPILATSMTLSGADGDDDINGAAGTDIIIGGNGDDSISGGGGNDTLTGSAGADTIDGGAGADTISFITRSDGSALVTLTDVAAADDDFDAVAGTDTDDVSFVVADDVILVDGTLEARLEAAGAAQASGGGVLDFDTEGVYLIDAADANLNANNFGDVSDVATNATIGFGAAANPTAGDEIIFTIENALGTETGVYYFQDVDGDGDVSNGDILALIAIVGDTSLTAADFTV